MAFVSIATLIEEVETAIRAILAGAQSYSVQGRSLTRADLSQLMEMRRALFVEYGKTQDADINFADFETPS